MASSFVRQIVQDSLRIRERERLWIHTYFHTYDLAEEIASEAQNRGASPVISIFSDSLLSQVLKKAPQEAVSTLPDHWLNGIAKASSFVFLDGPEDPGILKSADKGKALLITGHQTKVLGTAVLNRVRTLHVLTTSFTESAAKIYGINYSQWTQAMNRCLAANQAVMLDISQRIVKLFRKHRSIHISSSNGTDVRFQIRSSPPIIDDGVIDQEDIKHKSFLAHLPAGTVSVPIDEKSTEGTIVFDTPRAFLGDIINNLRLDFTKGQLTGYRALKGENTFARAFRASQGMKDKLSRISFGVNPNASKPLGQPMDALIQGTVTLGLGDNTFIGGRNQSNFSYEHTLANAIVSIGPTAVIMDGKLII